MLCLHRIALGHRALPLLASTWWSSGVAAPTRAVGVLAPFAGCSLVPPSTEGERGGVAGLSASSTVTLLRHVTAPCRRGRLNTAPPTAGRQVTSVAIWNPSIDASYKVLPPQTRERIAPHIIQAEGDSVLRLNRSADLIQPARRYRSMHGTLWCTLLLAKWKNPSRSREREETARGSRTKLRYLGGTLSWHHPPWPSWSRGPFLISPTRGS